MRVVDRYRAPVREVLGRRRRACGSRERRRTRSCSRRAARRTRSTRSNSTRRPAHARRQARRSTPPVPGDPAFADADHSYPGTIVVARDGRRAYVVNEAAGTVSAIDTATRTLTGPTAQVGFFPFGAAIAGDRLLVTDEGPDAVREPARSPAPRRRSRAVAPTRSTPRRSRSSALAAGRRSLRAAHDAPPFANARAADGSRARRDAHRRRRAPDRGRDDARRRVRVRRDDERRPHRDRVAARHAARVGGTELRLFDQAARTARSPPRSRSRKTARGCTSRSPGSTRSP